MARADSDGLSAVRPQGFAVAEIVAVDMMMILLAERIIRPNDEGGPLIGLSGKIAVFHGVVLSPEAYPVALLGFVLRIIIEHHTFG